MLNHQYFKNRIFDLHHEEDFKALALKLFQYQALHNEVYKNYLQYLGCKVGSVSSLNEIPFLPINFFKSFKVQTGEFVPEVIYTSSGTGGQQSSRHLVREKKWYENSFLKAFRLQYGEPGDYCFLALLPSYLERKGSSLIDMAARLIELSGDKDSGFYLDNHDELIRKVEEKVKGAKKVFLLGVSFALLDLAEYHHDNWSSIILMETGGMKGRRKEMIRYEVHQELSSSFKLAHIHSEYGMTELMSQAYSKGEGLFECPPWMKVIIREVADPFTQASLGKTGGINIIDLANVDSCAFIETQDLGRLHADERFEVMGRFDHADIRGCNLMVI